MKVDNKLIEIELVKQFNMTSRSISSIFVEYEKARWTFVQAIANIALKKQNVDELVKLNVLNLLKPLLNDSRPQIKQCAYTALGRLIQNSNKIARTVIKDGILSTLVKTTAENLFQKRGMLFVIRSLCKADPETTTLLVQLDGLKTIVEALEDFDPSVKESGLCCVTLIARHNDQLARSCVDFGILPLVILCLQEPELSIKQAAAGALSEIAKHSVELAQYVADGTAIIHLAKNLKNPDDKLKRLVLACLSSCAKHSTELAESVVEAECFPSVLMHLAHACPMVRKEAAHLVENVVKHSLELAQLVVNCGGIGALIETLKLPSEASRMPCIAALGYIAGHSDQLAMSLINCNAVIILKDILFNETTDDLTLCVTAWCLGNIGRFSPEHTRYIAEANIFPKLLKIYLSSDSSKDLKQKCRFALKLCLQKCLLIDALEPILYEAPAELLKYILCQYSKILPNDPVARRKFVVSGGLKKVQQITAKPGSSLYQLILTINECFPEEIVKYYSPGYPETLLEQVEQYSPKLMSLLRNANVNEEGVQTCDDLSSEESVSGNVNAEQN